MSDPKKLFGNKVRAMRKERGWSQEELADASELDRTYIGGIERGERNVSIMNIAKIARALGVTAASLIPF